MNTPKFLRQSVASAGLIVGVLLAAGCVSMTISTGMLTGALSYPVQESKTKVNATVELHVRHSLSPDVKKQWLSSMVNDETIANFEQAVVNVIANDIVQSGIFSKVVSSAPEPDFIVNIDSEQYLGPGPMYKIHYEVFNASKQRIGGRTEEVSTGKSARDTNLKDYLPSMMDKVKEGILKDVIAYIQARAQQIAKKQAEAFQKATLSELIVSSDRSVGLARERNRYLIAAKNAQLPAMLRDWKTDQLAAFVVKLEQAILDLNHESEVAKDRAEQSAASGGASPWVDEQRGLAISYRERIELLKPILAAVKDEISNRSR